MAAWSADDDAGLVAGPRAVFSTNPPGRPATDLPSIGQIGRYALKRQLGEGGLGFDDAVIGIGAGIFFIGYFLLEIPGTLIVEKWSARKWIARIMISWGVVAALMGLIGTHYLSFLCVVDWCAIFRPVTTALGWITSLIGVNPPEMTNCSCEVKQFYFLRFILGIAEAGFFPGIVVYLSHWFRYEDRAKAKSVFMVGLPIATVIGVPLSRLILEKVHMMGWSGWRWVFIYEGIPSVIFGIITLFWLPDWPKDAKWLPEDEKAWLEAELEKERREHPHQDDSLIAAIKVGLKHPGILLLAAVYFFIVTGYYGLNFFLPSMAALMHGISVPVQTVITMLPYVFGLLAMLFCGWSSDRKRERTWHTAVPLMLGAVGLGLSVLSGNYLALVVIFLCMAGAGMHGYMPVMWTWPTTFLTASAAATGVGFVNSVGNLGGFIGPYVVGWLKNRTGNFTAAMWFLVACVFISGLLATRLGKVERGRH